MNRRHYPQSIGKPTTPGTRNQSVYAGRSNDLHRQQESQIQRQNQKVIQDQNYSNNIMMQILSTLESLETRCKGRTVRRDGKMYGHYDKINYDDKNYLELKSQLQTQLGIYKASRQVFRRENPTTTYKLPSSFNEDRLASEISRYKRAFKDDSDLFNMCLDFEKLANNNPSNLFFEKHNFDVKYSEQETKKQRQQVFSTGLFAQDRMEDERRKIEQMGVKRPEDLPVYVNNSVLRGNQYQMGSRLHNSHPFW